MELIEAGREKILMLRMTNSEALLIIESLVCQLISGDCNADRYEQYLDDGRDFSISVHSKVNSTKELYQKGTEGN